MWRCTVQVFRRSLLPVSPRCTTSRLKQKGRTVTRLFSTLRTSNLNVFPGLLYVEHVTEYSCATWLVYYRVLILSDKRSSLPVTIPPRVSAAGWLDSISTISESTGNEQYLWDKTRSLYITKYVQCKMVCFKRCRFLPHIRHQFYYIVEGQGEKQYDINSYSYLFSKLAESVKRPTGIQDLSDWTTSQDTDCPDRLLVIILTVSRQILAYYPQCGHCCFLPPRSQFSVHCHSTVPRCVIFSNWRRRWIKH